MSDAQDSDLSDAQLAPVRQAEIAKDRRRPGRIHNVSPALIPLLRNPTTGVVAGDLVPVDTFKIAAAWTASAYPPDVWHRLSPTERAAAIDRELRKLDAAYAEKRPSD